MTKKAAGVVLTLMSLLSAIVCSTAMHLPTTHAIQARAILSFKSNDTVDVKHQPDGTAQLFWFAAKQTLSVTISLTGLAPNSTHPAHIHKGSCDNDQGVLDKLNDITANDSGVGTSSTSDLGQITQGILDAGLFINVHNGPKLQPDYEFLPIACAPITLPDLTHDHRQTLRLNSTKGNDQSVTGTAKVTLIDSTDLEVEVTLQGLDTQPHVTHIHRGSCEKQGPVVVELVRSRAGTTVVSKVKLQQSISSLNNLYVNVHLATRPADLSTQSGFDPIACGDLA